jgi:Domain of unkown function (DUF1775)
VQTAKRPRHVLTVTAALGIVVAAAGPASAHVEVSADGAQAGTGPVTLLFSAESESPTVGIVSIKTQLPSGIAPADVTLASGPAGWVLTPTTDGFELGGAEVAPGVDAEYSVTVAQLPADSTELVFPTLQRYADGREDAWIEPVTQDIPNPEMPAPSLTVAPAPPEATPAPTTSAAPTSEAASSTTAQPQTASDSAENDSNTGTVAVVAGVLIVAAIGAGAWWWRSRRSG